MVDLGRLQAQADYAAGAARHALGEAQAAKGGHGIIMQELQRQARELQAFRDALSRVNVQAQSGDPNIQRIENIPGRRIPYDFLVEIPFVAGNAAVQQGIITIDQSGPFVAVARTAAFISTYQFQIQQNGTTALLSGRSWGRCRPVHSALDFNDGQPFSDVSMAVAFPGTGSPHIASPSNQSPWRSMEMDFRIEMQEQGSSIRRQNIPMLSSLWVGSRGDAYELGALDFFERSQVIAFNVQPTHVPNPEFGNINSFTGGGTEWPFAGSGWDAIEGINDEIDGTPDSDPVTRLPSGVLQIGFHGYRIMQPPGPGQY